MRILSQDGRTDFPYERACLEVSGSGKIFHRRKSKKGYGDVARGAYFAYSI